MLDWGVHAEADLASYLLFDGPFCRRLIEMGRSDARARRDELLHFWREAMEPPGGSEEEPLLEETGRFYADTVPLGT